MSILLILLSPGPGCYILTPLRDRRPRRSIPSQERPLLATSVCPEPAHVSCCVTTTDPHQPCAPCLRNYDTRARETARVGSGLNRINRILVPTSCNFFSGSPPLKKSKVKRACPGAMGDRPGSSSRVRTSEDKVHRKDLCWSVRAVYILEKLPDVSGPSLEEVGRYIFLFGIKVGLDPSSLRLVTGDEEHFLHLLGLG